MMQPMTNIGDGMVTTYISTRTIQVWVTASFAIVDAISYHFSAALDECRTRSDA